MVMDYSEKRPGGVRDTVERKPVQKNRPRKEPIGVFALLSVVVLVLTFGAGVLTGWVIKGARTKAPAPVAAAQPVKKEEAAPPADQKPPVTDAQLTFYKTLPAGGTAAMGSGLNLKKPQPAAAAPRPAPVPAPSPAPPAAEKEEAAQGASHYAVQLASYRNKPEADAALAKLTAKGMAAYIVESKLADKGTWYRIRVGKGLSKVEAEELAGKSGKGALVLQE